MEIQDVGKSLDIFQSDSIAKNGTENIIKMRNSLGLPSSSSMMEENSNNKKRQASQQAVSVMNGK